MSAITRLAELGVHFPDVLIPGSEIDLEKWAVIACDQFTSDPDYWAEVEAFVGDAPSTLRIMLPEIYLEGDTEPASVYEDIKTTMRRYLDSSVFRTLERSAIYLRRHLRLGGIRRGIVVALDLERYDYHRGSDSLIRASEETIPGRLPARIAIRRGAAIETPHVLVLYDDPDMKVTNRLESAMGDATRLYDTPLMMEGGRIEGYRIKAEDQVVSGLSEDLASLTSREIYGFLFATGDGNHSLAAAKEAWVEKKRAGAHEDDPARYCLVELVNLHDSGLPMHPIHRIAATEEGRLLEELLHRGDARFHGMSASRLVDHMERDGLSGNEIGFLGPVQAGILSLPDASAFPVALADDAIAAAAPRSVDYTHGLSDTIRAAEKTGAVAIFLPEIDRSTLFPTIARNGALPRKAFSLGEARDKRYYLECRAL